MGKCFAVSSGIMGVCGAAAPSVRISTSPSQGGPFRVGQTVQFTCEMDPAQAHPVTYQWQRFDGDVLTFSSRSFNRTYQNYFYRYCWYFCTITQNGTLLGSADKFIEVHGK